MKEGKCKKKVWSSGNWCGHQCTRNIWKDGYCKQHHLDIVKARDKTRDEKWERERREKDEKNPILLLRKANEQIKELEVEIEKLNQEIVNMR